MTYALSFNHGLKKCDVTDSEGNIVASKYLPKHLSFDATVEEIFNVPENAEVWNRLFLLVESANKGVDNVPEI